MPKVEVFQTYDCILIVFITLISIITRIWLISSPDSITFDEVYFGNFTNYYINRTYFHDIHPPLAKLIMFTFAYLSGYKGQINFGHNCSLPYLHDDINYISLRLTPAIIQSFCFPLIYAAMRYFSFSSFTSFSTSFHMIFEPSLLVEGRFILSDGILHFFSCLNIFAISIYIIDYESNYLWFAALSLGCAISCKHTAFGLIAFDGFSQLIWIYKYRPSIKEIIERAFKFLFPAFSIFFLTNLIHFLILIYKGPGNDYFPSQISKSFLNLGSYGGLQLLGRSIYYRMYHLVINTLFGHMMEYPVHPYESRPEYWPFLMSKYIVFASFPQRNVILIGSPLTYWPATFSLAVIAVLLPFKNILDWRHLLLLFGWISSYFPFFLIPRSMFLYHYLIPLIISVMCEGSLVEILFKKYYLIKYLWLWLMIFGGIISYVIWYPTIYGTVCESCLEIREWINRWKTG